MSTNSDKIPDHQNAARNRAAYERLAAELEAWRKTVWLKFSNSATCAHEWIDRSGVEVCKLCGYARKLADREDIDR